MRYFSTLAIACAIASLPLTAQANWQVEPTQSTLRFVTVKNDVIAESHRLSGIQGQWGTNGQASFQIDVKTLDTLIPIRNERMLEHLFQSKQYPHIQISTQIDPKIISQLAVGATLNHKTSLDVTILNERQQLPVEFTVVKLTQDRIFVTPTTPISVSATTFKLDQGVAKLQELAKLNRIELSVPVTFQLYLQHKK